MTIFKSCTFYEDCGKKTAIVMRGLKSGKCNRSIPDQTHTTPVFSVDLQILVLSGNVHTAGSRVLGPKRPRDEVGEVLEAV